MCGRYTLAAPDPARLRARFGLGERVEINLRYNVAPGDAILAITTDRQGAARAEHLRWGLVPPFMSEPPPSGRMINARAESVADKPAFRGAFARFRCLIPADGFYEWARLWDEPSPGARRAGPKQPFHITRADHQPVAFAGLWSVWHRDGPDEIRSATIITTAANDAIAPLHDRMPVIMNAGDEATWLAPDTPAPVLHQLLGGLGSDDVALRPVGPAVNNARHDGPDCLADLPAGTPAPQTSLF
jgi:putative SOS response-associated peptidase YedK